jgi:hypothetical protein
MKHLPNNRPLMLPAARFTTAEAVESSGYCQKTVLKKLKEGIAAGVIQRIGRSEWLWLQEQQQGEEQEQL